MWPLNRDQSSATLPKPPRELVVHGKADIVDRLLLLTEAAQANLPTSYIHSHGQKSERVELMSEEDKELLLDTFHRRTERLCSLLNPDCSMSGAQLEMVISLLVNPLTKAMQENNYILAKDDQSLITLATFINTCRP